MALGALALVVPLTAGAASRDTKKQTYVVLIERGASADAAKQAVRRAGGRVVSLNSAVGVATVRSTNADFVADVSRTKAVQGAARNRPIGEAPATRPSDQFAIERMSSLRARAAGEGRVRRGGHRPPPLEEPLANLQWDMKMIGATPNGSYKRTLGRSGVLVGVIDTGIDGNHPDLAPNFDEERSRNFTTDIPLIDGPCTEEPDHSCADPADVDEDGHGTHVSGTVAAAYNGFGISGIAPKVTLVNLRAGQDSGFFFLKPTVDALTYAGDIGVDVVNMSFFVDPWLYNCPSNAADSPAEQQEQRTIIAAVQRAIDYARSRGVTTIAASGTSTPISARRRSTRPAPTSRPTRPRAAPSTTAASTCRPSSMA